MYVYNLLFTKVTYRNSKCLFYHWRQNKIQSYLKAKYGDFWLQCTWRTMEGRMSSQQKSEDLCPIYEFSVLDSFKGGEKKLLGQRTSPISSPYSALVNQ